MKNLLIIIIRAYQRYWSSWHLPSCRFYPSCSSYAVEALEKYGIWRGSFFIIRRVARCHPFQPGGYDPVP